MRGALEETRGALPPVGLGRTRVYTDADAHCHHQELGGATNGTAIRKVHCAIPGGFVAKSVMLTGLDVFA